VAEPARRKRDEAPPPTRKLAGVRGVAAGRALDGLIHHRLRMGIVSAQYIACTKTFENRRPRTEYRITAQGRRELQRYLDHMEALIHATRSTLER
jgi:hypothetical protein